MPEIIEPADREEAAEEIAALQDVPAEDEDVKAHSSAPVGGVNNPNSSVSAAVCA